MEWHGIRWGTGIWYHLHHFEVLKWPSSVTMLEIASTNFYFREKFHSDPMEVEILESVVYKIPLFQTKKIQPPFPAFASSSKSSFFGATSIILCLWTLKDNSHRVRSCTSLDWNLLYALLSWDIAFLGICSSPSIRIMFWTLRDHSRDKNTISLPLFSLHYAKAKKWLEDADRIAYLLEDHWEITIMGSLVCFTWDSPRYFPFIFILSDEWKWLFLAFYLKSRKFQFFSWDQRLFTQK